MKLVQEPVDWFSSVNPPKHKFTNNYTSCSILLHYVHGLTDPQIAVDVDCACVAGIVYWQFLLKYTVYCISAKMMSETYFCPASRNRQQAETVNPDTAKNDILLIL